MIQPEQLKKNEPLVWSAGTGTDVWELFCAIIRGDLRAVQRLVTKDPSIVRCHYAYRTPMYFAVRENQVRVAAYLLEHGADPLSLAVNDSLLDITRDRGYEEMRTLLETNYASTQGASPKGEAIAAAIRQRDLARVRELLDEDPSLANRPSEYVTYYACSGTPLRNAVAGGHIEIVRLLLARGADPNLPEKGIAPRGHALYSAVYTRHFDIAQLLLEHGADPSAPVESSADCLGLKMGDHVFDHFAQISIHFLRIIIAFGRFPRQFIDVEIPNGQDFGIPFGDFKW
jgi:ankyrin repeat protein